MRLAVCVGALAITVSAPAAAGPLLWDKVEAGMSFEQVKTLYPDGHVHTGRGLNPPMIALERNFDGCDALVFIRIDRKVAEPGAKVDSVELSGERCDAKMFTGLLAKYGEPMTLNNDNDDKKKTARWVAGGRSIVYKRSDGGSWA